MFLVLSLSIDLKIDRHRVLSPRWRNRCRDLLLRVLFHGCPLTFVSLMGLDGAREFATKLHQEALDSLSVWGDNADLLRAIASKVVNRDS